jgi:hypothetical protein
VASSLPDPPSIAQIADPMRETVLACLIVCDEAERLPAALASVSFCDQIVVVDSELRDGTVDPARPAGRARRREPLARLRCERNVAFDHATGRMGAQVDERGPIGMGRDPGAPRGPTHEHGPFGVLEARASRGQWLAWQAGEFSSVYSVSTSPPSRSASDAQP